MRMISPISAGPSRRARLARRWRETLPNPILTVALDEWVHDFDATLARVLAHLDLPPDQNCARFYEVDREVRSASRTQVRQPINAPGSRPKSQAAAARTSLKAATAA